MPQNLYRNKYRTPDGTLKRANVWWMEFQIDGNIIRESTHETNLERAKKVLDKRRNEVRDGVNGINRAKPRRLFTLAAKDYLELKQKSLSPNSYLIEETNLRLHLKPEFDHKFVCNIEADDVKKYQEKRQEEGAAGGTINLEVGTLRAILKREGRWAYLQPDVKMLTTHDDVGRAISADEEKALLRACSESRSRSLLPFVTLAIETGARFGVIRTLQWGAVDFERCCLKFGKDKTRAGTGRVVPLNPRAVAVLKFWGSCFPDRQPEHYVFPSERYGGKGKDERFGFTSDAVAYKCDPTKAIGDIKQAWEGAKKRTAVILKGTKAKNTEKIEPFPCRFHDLRHTAISRMLDAGVPITKVAKIVGWSPSTMVQMAARYGHFTLDELRGAVETISRVDSEQLAQIVKPIPPEQRQRAN